MEKLRERKARPVPSWADVDPNACCQSNNTARQGVDKIATERVAPAEVEAQADVMLDWEWKKEIGQEGTMTYGRASERVLSGQLVKMTTTASESRLLSRSASLSFCLPHETSRLLRTDPGPKPGPTGSSSGVKLDRRLLDTDQGRTR
ncbi:unnamed protein product, partial [Clonostachys rhizophaga]